MERSLRLLAFAASTLVIMGFAGFAVDQFQTASQRSQDELAGVYSVDPSATQERAREKRHARVREWVDDANDVLLSPVAWVTEGSPHVWVRRGVPALLALLLYGFGLGMVARFSHGSAREHQPRPSPV